MGKCLMERDDFIDRRYWQPLVVPEGPARRMVTGDERMRQAAVQQSERHAGVSRVENGALTFDEHDVVIPGALEGDRLRGAGDEVSHDGVDTNPPSVDENSRLAS